MPAGTVTAIHLAAAQEAPVFPVERVDAVAGTGLRGDRYFAAGAEPARQLTLVESEELEHLAAVHGIALEPGASRRQVTTSGVRLNPLVGRRFRIGEVVCRGVELCEPCTDLQRSTGRPEILRAFVHRAGLNAEILTSGEIAVGAPIVVLDEA